LLTATARAAAEAFEADTRGARVTFRGIEPGSSFQGGAVRGERNAPVVAPIVTVAAAHGRDAERKARIPRPVAVEYREIPPGRFAEPG
jgi:hypothetical protein